MDGKSILDAVIALIIYIIFAIIYFVILAFVVRWGTELVCGSGVYGDVSVATAILAGATIVAGGGLMDAFKKP
jgi:hypothetical protein